MMRKFVLFAAVLLALSLCIGVAFAETPAEKTDAAPQAPPSEEAAKTEGAPQEQAPPSGEPTEPAAEAAAPVAEEHPVEHVEHVEHAAPAHDDHAMPHGNDAHTDAAHHGNDAHADAHHEAPFKAKELIAGIINFLIFIYLIYKLGKSGISGFFRGRAKTLMASVKEAEEALAEVNKLHDEAMVRKERLEEETKQIVEGAKARAKQQAEQILEEAKALSARMVDEAKNSISVEAEMAMKKLRVDLVNSALDIAKGQVQQKLDADSQKKLVDQFMSKMEDLQ